MPAPRPDLFISADIETDGPIPGPYSMLSFALTLASTFDGERFVPIETSADNVFYAELKPISDRFDPEALAVNGLDRDRLAREGTSPADAMRAADHWVRQHAGNARPVLVAYPVAFDWSFLYWYFVHYTADSPFGFSSCLDIRTLYQARALTTFDASNRDSMPALLHPQRRHTHHAVDDALEQGELFNNLFAWALSQKTSCRAVTFGHQEGPDWLKPMLNPISHGYEQKIFGSKMRRLLDEYDPTTHSYD
ncbi:MAG TPA: hypothetical protein VFT79_09965 [Solirubrobacterales bacterium]|nr:hypothetical protein [Solirubrobacterales bacterium]